ncbi:hypothetical protein PO909_000221, partial [Leuciscus waleckii]
MNVASPSYELSGVSSGVMHKEMFCHIDHMTTASLRFDMMFLLHFTQFFTLL